MLAELAGNDLGSGADRHVLSASIGRDVDAGSAARKQNYVMVNYQKLFGE